jgi:hypothetical protein
MEDRNDWSIRRLVRTADRYRVIEIQVGDHTITATNLLPDDLRTADAALIENSHTIRRLPGVFSNVAVGNQIADYYCISGCGQRSRIDHRCPCSAAA